jgi:hypothetical protein
MEMRPQAIEVVCGKQFEQSISSRLKWLIHDMVLRAPVVSRLPDLSAAPQRCRRKSAPGVRDCFLFEPA